jgi:hypothetical protein
MRKRKILTTLCRAYAIAVHTLDGATDYSRINKELKERHGWRGVADRTEEEIDSDIGLIESRLGELGVNV